MLTVFVREFLAGLLSLLIGVAPAAPIATTPAQESSYVQQESSPARTMSVNSGNVSLSVDSPAGALPRSAKATLSKVSKPQLNKIRKEAATFLGTEVIDAVAFDISFVNKGIEIEPDGKVNITVNFPAIAEAPCYTIIHFRDDGTTEIVPGNVTTTSATFSADNFSVYAVVGTTNYKRMTVNFYNDTTLIETMYVKDSDTLAELKKIIYDPGAGTIPEGQAFLGWSFVENYTDKTASYTIDGVRTEIKNMTFVDGKVINVYARIFKVYAVTYLVSEGVSLGSDPVFMHPDATEVEYTISQSFTPELDTQDFEGWTVADGSDNIVGYVDGKIYKFEDKITVKGDVSLKILVADGHWLVYDENAKGATYNAPQFYKTEEVTSDAELLDMYRTGYEFGGWYYFADGVAIPEPDEKGMRDLSNATKFTFGSVLTENMTLYAKWTEYLTAPYTVLIWKQNVSGTGYDFAESVRITGNVGSVITSVTSVGSGNDAYARVNGSNKIYAGFHLNDIDTNVKVAPEGNTVLNVYYDRNIVTLTFRIRDNSSGGYEATSDTTGELFGLVNGQYVSLFSTDGGSTWYTTAGSEYVETEILESPIFAQYNEEYILLSYDESIGWYYYNSEEYAQNSIGDKVYGIIDNHYVELTYRDGSYFYVSGVQQTYTETTSLEPTTQYGIVDGEYVEIFYHDGRVNKVWWYYIYNQTTSSNGTQYGLVDGKYVQLSRSGGNWYYNNGTTLYSGTRYTRQEYSSNNNSNWYSGTRYLLNEVAIETEYDGLLYTHNIPYSGPYFKLEATQYDGQRYKVKSGSDGWRTIHQFTGLYGSSLSDNNCTWPTDYWYYDNYSNSYGTYSGSGTRTTFLDAFLLSDGGSDQTFYGFTGNGSYTIRFYKKNSDGNWPAMNAPTNTVTTTATSNSRFYISDKYNGYKAVSYSTNGGTTWIDLGDKDSTTGYYATIYIGNYDSLDIRYEPLLYNMSFMDGVYVNGDGKPVAGYESIGQLHVVENIAYNSNISSYNEGNADYYEPEFAEFTFVGWYLDDACTQPYTFSTMPEGLTVYAKWIQNQYRVFLHSNAEGDDTLFWGSSSQSMSFRISSGSAVSLPTGTRDGYKMIGWYVDEGLSTMYSKDTHLSDTFKYLTDYDMTTRMTDPMDIHGNIITNGSTTPYNSDATGYDGEPRFWITKQLDIYCKWSATLPGADGINVVYDANGGTNEPTDTILYKDNVNAIAGAASTPPADEEVRFESWLLQTWDQTNEKYVDTEITVFPGADVTVLKANAKTLVSKYEYKWTVDYKLDGKSYTLNKSVYVTPTSPVYPKNINTNPAHPTDVTIPEDDSDVVWNLEINYTEATYTVQLKAVYNPIESGTPTHIIFFGNGGTKTASITGTYAQGVVNTDTYVGYKTLKINEAVDIAPAGTFTKEGYKFLGWARVTEPTGFFTTAADGTITIDANKLTAQELNESNLWLTYVPAEGEETDSWQCTVDGSVKTVSQIAADEKNPYQLLYAVWEKAFYIYHTGVAGGGAEGKPEARFVSDLKGQKLDLTKIVTSGTYYGGYYTDGQCTLPTAVDGVIPAYDGTNWKWNPPASYTEKGSAITPQTGVTYYIKEVPRYYMLPYAHMTYQGGIVKNLMVVTDFDDYTYALGGFTVNGTDVNMYGNDVFYTSLKVTTSVGGSSMILKPGELYTNELFPGYVAENYTVQGYIGYLWINSYLTSAQSAATDDEPAKITVGMWWKTPDGEIVRSDVTRTIVIENNTVDGIYYTDSDATATAVGGGNG